MTTIDNNIVGLGLDNAGFKDDVSDSLKALDNLKKGLDFKEQSKSLETLARTSNELSFEKMSGSLSAINERFSSFGIVSMAVLANITNSVINLGKKLLNDFLAPAKKGFAEYETQMNAIQTVLANTESKGTTLDDVIDALDELNLYADKTIYNFTEMTRNIGTFTAAGVDLDTSVSAIKGIANLAAVSGSNAQQASTAMYQLSQALSSGTVKLQDWNSVVNAGMGGQVFQDALKQTARVHGVAIDNMIKNEGSFRETLQKGWLTSEILLETLEKFTGDLSKEQLIAMGYTEEQTAAIIKLGQTANDAATKVKTLTQLKDTLAEALQSGWTKTWQIIIGDFGEAKELFTEISDTLGELINASGDARNNFLQQWKDMGGRNALISTLRNSFTGLLTIIKPIKEAFTDIFPPASALELYKLSLLLAYISNNLRLTGDQAEKVKRAFKGIFAAGAIVKDVLVAIGSELLDIFSGINVDGEGILDWFANFGDGIIKFRESLDIKGSVANIFSKGKEYLSVVGMETGKTVDVVKEKLDIFKTYLDVLRAKTVLLLATTGSKLAIIRNWIKGLFSDVDPKALSNFLDNIKKRLEPLTSITKIVSFVLSGIANLAKSLLPILTQVGVGIYEFGKNIVTGIFKTLGSQEFNTAFDTINGGIFTAVLLALRNFLNGGADLLGETSGFLENVTGILDGVGGSLKAWQENLKAKTLLTIASAVGVLALSLFGLTLIDSKKLTIAIATITTLFVELLAAQAMYSKGGVTGATSSLGIMAMSSSILILSGAVAVLAKLDREQMANALLTIFSLMTGMTLLSRLVGSNTDGLIKSSIGIMAISLSLLLMSGVVKKLGEIDPSVLQQGLISIGIVMAEIAAFTRLVDTRGSVSAVALLGLSAAIMILAMSVEKFGLMDVGNLQQGLAAIGIIMAEVAAFSQFTSGGNLLLASSGLVIFGGAILLLTKSISDLGKMSIGNLVTGLLGMGSALAIVSVAMRSMPKDMILTASGLLVASAALVILAQALKTLGEMTLEQVGISLLAMSGALIVLAFGLTAMSGTLAGSAALIVASIALTIMANVMKTLGSMPLNEIGLSLLALSGIFVVLGIAGYALTPVIPTLLSLGGAMLMLGAGAALVGLGLLSFSAGLAALAISGAAGAAALVSVIATILGVVPLIITALVDAIVIFANLIAEATPAVAIAITALLQAFLQIIIDNTPLLKEALSVLLLALIDLIIEVVPEFVKAVIFLLVTLLEEIAANLPDFIQAGFDILIAFLQGIADNISDVGESAKEVVVEFLDMIAENLPDIIDAGFDLIVAFINGMADGIEEHTDELLEAVGNLAGAIIDGFVAGIKAGSETVIATLVNLALAAFNGAKEALGINSPSRLFKELGEGIPEGLAMGIYDMAKLVVDAASDLALYAEDGMTDALSEVANGLSETLNMDPKIRPVVDMTEIDAMASALDEMTKQYESLKLATTNAYLGSKEYIDPPDNSGSFRAENDLVVKEGISFVQNNYSPKPLSRLEIYRQTKLQLNTIKQVLTEG